MYKFINPNTNPTDFPHNEVEDAFAVRDCGYVTQTIKHWEKDALRGSKTAIINYCLSAGKFTEILTRHPKIVPQFRTQIEEVNRNLNIIMDEK